MENILVFSYITIMFLFAIIIGSKYAMNAKIRERYKIIILAVLHSVIYCLAYHAYDFIQWTIRLNKYDSYPYRNQFCILVIIYCIISFIILGVLLRMKHKKDEYPISTTIILWFIIHILAILLAIKIFIPLIPFRPFFID